MHTPSDAGWLGRNFLRLLLVIHPVACAVYVLSWERVWYTAESVPTGTAAAVLLAVVLLGIPVAVLGGAYLALVALLTGFLPRAGLPLLCASVAAGVVLAVTLVADTGDGAHSLMLWYAVAVVLTLGVWSEFDDGG